jgi:hypothetical protein
MNGSAVIRAAHRWIGVTLLALTIVSAVTFGLGLATPWLFYLPLLPLMLSGLYPVIGQDLRLSRISAQP